MLRWPAAAAALALLLLLIAAASPTAAFYLPGVAPNDFQKKDPLQVKVNKLSSTKTQLPYSYYSLPFCKPDTIVDSAENLGEVLRGDRIENSPYVFEMREPKMCQIVCKATISDKQAKELEEKIEDEYRVNMILDNLPLVVPIARTDRDALVFQGGYHVGVKGQYAGSKDEKYFIHNHLAFLVKYHKDENSDLSRIVGFEVKPFSVKHQFEEKWNDANTRLSTCDPHANKIVINSDTPQEVEAGKDIIFTYDVGFEESDIKWASRWDTYLLMTDDQIHWFSIVNSLMIVLFLSGMVAMIMLRTLYRDISRYNQLETEEEAQEETGWKLVHGDVFRPPTNSDLLCVYVGTGVQFFGMLLVTMMFAVLGFLSPSNRGGLMTAMLLIWVLMGLFAGYASSRLYKMFKGSEWKSITLKTAFLFPGIAFGIFFVLNALIWGEKSSVSQLLRSTQGSTVNHGDEVLVKVNELMSIEIQITYSYYSLPFCRPDNLTESAPTLWQLLHGDRQQRSPYQFEMRVPKKCQIVCRVLVGEKEAKELMEKMEDEYRVNIVKHQYEAQWNGANSRLSTCDANANRFILSSDSPPEIEVGEEIIFTYDVNFEESDIKWASRWDAYLSMTDDQARWFSIVNSPVTLIGLSVAMAMTMLRSLHRDIFRYSQLETQNEAQVETGWKLVHGDVFRPPSNPVLLCAYAGSGVQLFGTHHRSLRCAGLLFSIKFCRPEKCCVAHLGPDGDACWLHLFSPL
ncbi:hypothetical protein OsI_30213 [Oryza sativa Indica Group]|uniref:Transmembrane 9 superfamily member n=1 Tax=Oryza sativa subsp. indica TaxID=39946 RepID=B8B9E9_ORYSI|nr:hypothetical protein OsI_30213 [Oryza sativa Indica Group]